MEKVTTDAVRALVDMWVTRVLATLDDEKAEIVNRVVNGDPNADLHAAAALPKLDRLEEQWSRRVQLSARYDAALEPLDGIRPIGRPATGRHSHHLYIVRIDTAAAGADRDRYAEALMAENISTGLHFLPVHTLTWFRENLPTDSLPVTEAAGKQVLSLPLAAAHSTADVDDVVAALVKVHRAYAGS